MDKVAFTYTQPKGIWNAEDFADEIKYVFHNSKLSGKIKISFEKPFCKIKEMTLNVKKEIVDHRGFKTYVAVTDVKYEDKQGKKDYPPLKFMKTGS